MNEKQRIVIKDSRGNAGIAMGFRHGNFVVYCVDEKDAIWSLSTSNEVNHLLIASCVGDWATHDSYSYEVTETVSLLRAIATIFDLSGLSGCCIQTLEKMAGILEEHVGLHLLDIPMDDDYDEHGYNDPIDGVLYRYWHWRKSNRAGVK